MASGDVQKIEVPKSVKNKQTNANDVIIHVMPKEFYGKDVSLQGGVQKPEPKPVPPPPPPPPPKPPVQKPVQPPKKKRGFPWLLLLLGLLFLIIIAVVAFFLLQGINDPEDPVDPPVVVVDPPDPDPPVIEIRPGVDTDSDGLTDREEALYGTDARNPDSDGDSFNDGNEVFHRFDPNGFAPSTLLDTGAVVEYIDDSYRLTYPRTWNLSPSNNGITMRSTTSANIIFMDQVVDIEPTALSAFTRTQTKEGYDLYSSADDRTSYVVVGDEVFEFKYDLNGSTTIDYVTTFQMITNSFVYTQQAEETEESEEIVEGEELVEENNEI